MASSSILQLPKAIPKSVLSRWTYDKEQLAKPGGMTDKLRVLPGPGALKIAMGDVESQQMQLVGIPVAPRYYEKFEKDAAGNKTDVPCRRSPPASWPATPSRTTPSSA